MKYKKNMKILLCFTGLERSIEKTFQNIVSNVFSQEHEYSIVFVTWVSESTEKFQSIFPQAHIHKISADPIREEFEKWKGNLQMHISWRRTYEPEYALFRYFQQIYLWKQAASFLNHFKDHFDLYMRIRTDINIIGKQIYPSFSECKENTIYFPSKPRQSIFYNENGCPDYYFFGKPNTVMKALSIVDYLDKYKVNYLEEHKNWFETPTLEENIIQPESSMYLFLEGEKIQMEFIENRIEVIR